MEQMSKDLQRLQNAEDLEKKQRGELSLYSYGKVTTAVFIECVSEIKKSFPKLPNGWYDVLEKMLDEEKFSNERFIDATKSLIKNCVYPEPTIANIIGYDKTIKVYTYNDLLEHSKDFAPSTRSEYLNTFDRIQYYGELRFARKEEISRFNLPRWIKK
jgi:hypothetical protein